MDARPLHRKVALFRRRRIQVGRARAEPEQIRNFDAEREGAFACYDVGLETLTTERFIVSHRQTIYPYPGTGAEARLLTITQRERNCRAALDEAFACLDDPGAKLLVNERSGRATVQIPTTSVTLYDCDVERRARLIRPMEGHNVSVELMGEIYWVEVDRDASISAWNAEIAEAPEFTDSTIHMVAGLLLLIWKWLPNDSIRVCRPQVSPAWAVDATMTCTNSLTPGVAFAAPTDGRTVLDLAEGLQLRCACVMDASRIRETPNLGVHDTGRGSEFPVLV